MHRLGIVTGLVVALALLAPALALSDDSSAATCDDIRVYVENADGEYDMSVVDGVSTVQGAIEAALADQGKSMELNSKGNVRSVDGREPEEDQFWRIHQWLPLGTSGWGLMAFSPESDAMMATGTSYCLHLCEQLVVDGTLVYSSPDFKPKAEGFVFIRFANGFAPDVPDMLAAFDAEAREKGFWLKGTGSDMGEVLKDAMESNGFQIELKSGMDPNGNNLQSWIENMFGLGDVRVEENVWSYWSQWTWVDHTWHYNDWTLGFYDPAVYRYVECIYLISAEDPYSSGYVIDKGGPEPNPETDEIFCISSTPLVTFALEDGTVLATQYLEYGGVPDMSKVPDPKVPAGKVFAGWGDVTAPVKGDTTFVAKFGDPTVYLVRYWDESMKAVLYVDRMIGGSASHFVGTDPYKAADDKFTYEFAGWSKDLSSVSSDMDVTPVFKAIPKGAAVGTEFSHGGLRYKVVSIDVPKVSVIGAEAAGAVEIPSSAAYDGKTFSVDSVAGGALKGSGLTSLSIKGGPSIGEEAFADCKSLNRVDTGQSKLVDGRAFQGCSSLEELRLGAVESIGPRAFQGCGSLKDVVFSESLFSVASDAFSVEFSDGEKKVSSASDLAGKEMKGSGGKLTDASYVPPSGDSTMLYVGIAVAVAIALIVALLVLRSRRSR
jgi:hypothetical protein